MGTYVNSILGILHHLDFGPVISPSRVSEQFCNLAAEVEHFGKEWDVNIEPRIIGLKSSSPNVWILGVFEERENIWSLEGDVVHIL